MQQYIIHIYVHGNLVRESEVENRALFTSVSGKYLGICYCAKPQKSHL